MVAGIWLASPGAARPLFTVVVAYVGVLFFGVCALYAAYRLSIRRPLLELDSTGITDTASAIGVGRVTWDEVNHVVLFARPPMLGIVPKDLDDFLGRRSLGRKLLTTVNLVLGFAPISVPGVMGLDLTQVSHLLRSRYGVRVEVRGELD